MSREQSRVRLAVNGTLMTGLELHENLLTARAVFCGATTTQPIYRLWSINDRHPAMTRVQVGGASIAVEVWSVPPAGLASILLAEPPGLCIGKVFLANGDEVLGVLGEPILCEGQKEITRHGGWRAYCDSRRNHAGLIFRSRFESGFAFQRQGSRIFPSGLGRIAGWTAKSGRCGVPCSIHAGMAATGSAWRSASAGFGGDHGELRARDQDGAETPR